MEELERLNNNRKPEIHTLIIWNGLIDKKIIKKKLNLSKFLNKNFEIIFNKIITK